jgi:hypothetical protein
LPKERKAAAAGELREFVKGNYKFLRLECGEYVKQRRGGVFVSNCPEQHCKNIDKLQRIFPDTASLICVGLGQLQSLVVALIIHRLCSNIRKINQAISTKKLVCFWGSKSIIKNAKKNMKPS